MVIEYGSDYSPQDRLLRKFIGIVTPMSGRARLARCLPIRQQDPDVQFRGSWSPTGQEDGRDVPLTPCHVT